MTVKVNENYLLMLFTVLITIVTSSCIVIVTIVTIEEINHRATELHENQSKKVLPANDSSKLDGFWLIRLTSG